MAPVRSVSGWRLMWIMVLYDLPVITKKERREARKFHDHLLNHGFEMAQLSVYMRMAPNKEVMERVVRDVGLGAPAHGTINILFFTDKQYENMVTIRGGQREGQPKNPAQYVLF